LRRALVEITKEMVEAGTWDAQDIQSDATDVEFSVQKILMKTGVLAIKEPAIANSSDEVSRPSTDQSSGSSGSNNNKAPRQSRRPTAAAKMRAQQRRLGPRPSVPPVVPSETVVAAAAFAGHPAHPPPSIGPAQAQTMGFSNGAQMPQTFGQATQFVATPAPIEVPAPTMGFANNAWGPSMPVYCQPPATMGIPSALPSASNMAQFPTLRTGNNLSAAYNAYVHTPAPSHMQPVPPLAANDMSMFDTGGYDTQFAFNGAGTFPADWDLVTMPMGGLPALDGEFY
jgi:hypothetical protein